MLRFLVAFTILAFPAAAQQQNCGPRESIAMSLNLKYGESLIGNGTRADRDGNPTDVIEMFANPETGSWTLVQSLPNGISCLRLSGGNWAEPQDPARFDPEA